MAALRAGAAPGTDPRLTPARPDLAAERLRGEVEAARYASPVRMRVALGVAPLRARPGAKGLASELVYGAAFEVYESAGGLAWGQAPRDGYVGYVPAEALEAANGPATHRVTAPLSHLYPGPDLKTAPLTPLPMNALLSGTIEGAWLVTRHGCAPAQHVAEAASTVPDWVDAAERFVGAPYLWGGGSALGIDCSGLVQAARWAAGFACPRDSDMQSACGTEVAQADLRRGDLVFWKGHVGVMLDGARLLHANAHHMACAIEPLAGAIDRIAAGEYGPPTGFRRLEG
ncbi:MAG: peptidase P60 [Rhodobacteraceae bacterium]|nr:peptidase P60 [Paracoccaceae bacterium]MBR28831.1 peptidase P60 [Paracoccaceae bacterium]